MNTSLKKIVLLPGRLVNSILIPWRTVYSFFTELPEETPVLDTVGNAISNRDEMLLLWQSLAEHLTVLRKAIFRSLIALIFTTIIGFSFATNFMAILAVPLQGDKLDILFHQPSAAAAINNFVQIGTTAMSTLQVIEPTEAIEIFMRVSLLAGVVLAMPWFVFELYLFIAPGLMPRARLMMIASIPIATLLFIAGMIFTYTLMLPSAVPFLRDFMFFRFAWRPAAYFSLVTSLLFWVGVLFELPLAVYALALAGWIRGSHLVKYWRFAIAGIAIVAAVITPTPDPVNMTIVMIPMFFLYGISILVAYLGQKKIAQPAA